MRVFQLLRGTDGSWSGDELPADLRPQLALAFTAADVPDLPAVLREVRQRARGATILGTSTAGEIHGDAVLDGCVSLTVIEFADTAIRAASLERTNSADCRAEGRELASRLAPDDLAHVFVLFEGLNVNGSELVCGLRETLPAGVGISGGLAADGDRFHSTFVLHGEDPVPARGVALGLYGSRLRVGCASLGGWDPFGPERIVTRSRNNVLFALDGKPALVLYKRYLGEYADKLPGSALLFPLCIRRHPDDTPLVRTILACDERAGTMTFAGDVPEGAFAQLMRANMDRLVEGAEGAAAASKGSAGGAPDLALLISCVGRKLVLQQHVEEEIQGCRRVLGSSPRFAGFYSYGEISPFTPTARCELHNQTMTITTLAEV